jgi:hypothetical protein
LLGKLSHGSHGLNLWIPASGVKRVRIGHGVGDGGQLLSVFFCPEGSTHWRYFSLDIVPDSDTQDDWTTREVSELGTMSEGERTVDSENSSHESVTEHGDLEVSQCIPARAGVVTRSRLQESHRAETVAQNPDPEPTVTGSSVATDQVNDQVNDQANFRMVVPMADPPPNARIIIFPI